VFVPTYSISKIAAEAVARFSAKSFGVPTVIARLCVPYGDSFGWPFFHAMMVEKGYPIALHEDRPNVFNLIHLDDIVRTIPALLDAASIPATIVNWAGDEQVSIEDWTAFVAERVGREPVLDYTTNALDSVVVDTTKLNQLAGPSTVHWKDGFGRMIDARAARRAKHA
jgi:UDP-glucuronate 4-epimerase